ncbi:MAG TPA: GNAT family N-acetyltransferase [Chloroflexia bacterium]|nr:GNAT family N-acetyltransferase [Chloroflexia bacterium]
MSLPARRLTLADQSAVERLLAAWPLEGAYAYSHLQVDGLGPDGVRGYGCAAAEGSRDFAAAILAHGGIAWALWRTPDEADALAGVVPRLGVDLLSGPKALVAPLVAQLPPGSADHGDHCPLQCITRGALLPAPAGPAHARAASLADMERLIDFYIRGFYSLARLPTREAWRVRLTEQLVYRRLYLIEDDEKILAAALSSAETPTAAMIGGVATLPSHRNQGLAGRCVHALCSGLFASGIQTIGLFYLPANTPAARVYTKLGFTHAGEWWLQHVGWV